MSDESPFEGFGIPLPLPAELIETLRKQHDQAHMAADAEVARIDRFISGLDVDGLLALRVILNTGDMSKSVSANFFDGQLVSILKYVHGVDPASGKDPLAIPDTDG